MLSDARPGKSVAERFTFMKIYYVGELNIWCVAAQVVKSLGNAVCALEGFELNDGIFPGKKETLEADGIPKIC